MTQCYQHCAILTKRSIRGSLWLLLILSLKRNDVRNAKSKKVQLSFLNAKITVAIHILLFAAIAPRLFLQQGNINNRHGEIRHTIESPKLSDVPDVQKEKARLISIKWRNPLDGIHIAVFVVHALVWT